MNPKHLYIHWPFCRKKCWYCDFISFEQHQAFELQYHGALCNEITSFSKEKKEIDTLFLGGGTPSLYKLELLQDLFNVLDERFALQAIQEATIEVNPGDVTEEHLKTWISLGINRLSIGVQILDENILRRVNRYQRNSDVIQLLEMAPQYFDNISIDLILGLPGTTSKIWFDTVEYIVAQPINHLSVYFLTIYEKTPLYFKICPNSALYDKKISLPDENWLVETYEKTIKMLAERGFSQYETSNFAKQGCESMHNKAYWNRLPYQGFGLSAASFDGKRRLVNSNNLKKYIDYWGQNAGQKPVSEEALCENDVFLEELMLGLRQKTGVDLQRMLYSLKRVFPTTKEKSEELEKKLLDLKKQGLIEEKNGCFFLTTRGMFLGDEIVIKLL